MSLLRTILLAGAVAASLGSSGCCIVEVAADATIRTAGKSVDLAIRGIEHVTSDDDELACRRGR